MRRSPADGEQKPDTATKLYEDDIDHSDPVAERGVASFFNQHSLSATHDGDSERVAELGAAERALAANMREAGTSSADFGEALSIVNECLADDPSLLAAKQGETMLALERDIGPSFAADLAAARSLIQDLERVAPGTIHSLERSGAGNDPRLIRKAIAEAKRRLLTWPSLAPAASSLSPSRRWRSSSTIIASVNSRRAFCALYGRPTGGRSPPRGFLTACSPMIPMAGRRNIKCTSLSSSDFCVCVGAWPVRGSA